MGFMRKKRRSETSYVLYMVGESFVGGGRDGEVLESRLWSKLPKKLLENVLAWLPLQFQARLRAVCKSWRLLLSSSSFQQNSVTVALARAPSCFFAIGGGWPPKSDFTSRHKTLTVDLAFIPGEYLNTDYCPLTQSGLLYCRKEVYGEWQLGVANLVNKSWRALPPSKRWVSEEGQLIIVTGKEATSGFQVLVLWREDREGQRHLLSVYSSVTNKWTTMLTTVDPSIRFEPSRALCSGIIYLFAQNAVSREYEMVLVDANDGKFVTKLSLPCPISGGKFPSAHNNGRVLWTSHSSQWTVEIWALDVITRTWSKLSVMPVDRFFPGNRVKLSLSLVNVHVTDDTAFLRLVATENRKCYFHQLAYNLLQNRKCYFHQLAYNLLQDSWHNIWRSGPGQRGEWIRIMESRPALQL